MWGMEKASIQEKQQKNQEVEQNIKNFTQKIERFLVEVNQLILDKPQQTKWEIWFVTSVIIIMGMIFIGTLDNSKEAFPNYLIWLGLVFINLCVSIGYGLKERE